MTDKKMQLNLLNAMVFQVLLLLSFKLFHL